MKGQSVGQPGLHGELSERKDGANTNECNESACSINDPEERQEAVVSGAALSGCLVSSLRASRQETQRNWPRLVLQKPRFRTL